MVENYYQRASSRNPLILVEKCFTNTPKVENKSPMATVFQVAASSEIGVARAAYFPQISLSGVQSSALSNLFSGPTGAWSFGASLTQPIFTTR